MLKKRKKRFYFVTEIQPGLTEKKPFDKRCWLLPWLYRDALERLLFLYFADIIDCK